MLDALHVSFVNANNCRVLSTKDGHGIPYPVRIEWLPVTFVFVRSLSLDFSRNSDTGSRHSCLVAGTADIDVRTTVIVCTTRRWGR